MLFPSEMSWHPGVQQQQQPTKDVQIQDGTYDGGGPAIVGGELEHGEGRLGLRIGDVSWLKAH